MELIDGKKIASEIRQELKEQLKQFDEKPNLVVILVGDDPVSNIYVKMKEKDIKEIGMTGEIIYMDKTISQKELEEKIGQLNTNDDVHGILVQLPLPSHLNEDGVLEKISPAKDVDGLHDLNVGRLNNNKESLKPCTPSGIMELLKRYNVKLEGQHAVIVGRSNLVGKPIARMLEQANCTITVCHSKTNPLKNYTKQADILIVAAGKPELISKNMVKDGAVVIDVGIHRINDELIGDVDFKKVKDKVSKITPVHGGVGPMTRAMLMVNTLKAFKNQNE